MKIPRINYFNDVSDSVFDIDYDLIVEPRCEFCSVVLARCSTFHPPPCSLRNQSPHRCILERDNIFKEDSL